MPRAFIPPSWPGFGSISTGTLKTDDLGSAFADVIKQYGNRSGKKLAREWDNLPGGLRWNGHDDVRPDWTPEQEEEAKYLVEEMRVKLEEMAPDYTYFGAHEGDGADFGFWPSHDQIAEDRQSGELPTVNDPSELAQLTDTGCVLHVNDHGNITMYVKTARKVFVLWDCV